MSQTYGAMKKLLAKHRRFVQEYLVDMNATAAAMRAGYTSRSRGSMKQVAYRLMQEPLIQQAIAAANSARIERVGLTADEVLNGIREVIAKDVPHERLAALALLGRHHKLFVDKVEHAGAGGEPISVVFNLTPPAK